MKKSRFFVVLALMLVLSMILSVGTMAQEMASETYEYASYYDIVEKISRKYGIEINFRPDTNITVSLEEFETELERNAKEIFSLNLY